MGSARRVVIGRGLATRSMTLVLTAQKERTYNMSDHDWDMAGCALICVLFLLFAMVMLR
jgi:hypothetical protein